MPRRIVPILTAALIVVSLQPADAATRKVRVPNRYDGAWSIVATTTEGPCSASTRYQVRIRNGDASIPGDDIDIDGGVASDGSVNATIVQGSNRVPISGALDRRGSGRGTWRSSGGLIGCSGQWSAKRAG